MSTREGRSERWESAANDESEPRRDTGSDVRPICPSRRARAIALIGSIAIAAAISTIFVVPAGAVSRDSGAPEFVSITTRALDRSSTGARLLVSAQVENSMSCRLVIQRSKVTVDFPRRWRSCENGRFAEAIRIAPSPATLTRVTELRLVARSRSDQIISRKLTIPLPANRSSQNAPAHRSETSRSSWDLSTFATVPQQSASWAGYVTTFSAPVKSASATWSVPSVTCGATTTWLGTWVGVDGAEASGRGTTTIFQDGIYSYCIDGKQQNEAWWEAYPGPANALGTVNTGDTISASVWQTNGRWMWSVTDLTTGASYRSDQAVQYSGPAETAEWIVEDPGSPSEPFVAGFSPVTFSDIAASVTKGPSFVEGSTWRMVQGGQILAAPDEAADAIASRHTMTVHSSS